MNKKITVTAALFGILAIIFGAFGAHLLKKTLTFDQINSFEIGVKYQMYHTFFLFFISVFTISEKSKKVIYNLTVFGVLFFSGSIYLLTTKNISGIDFKSIGFVTPIGGMLLILAWTVLLFDILKKKV
jgi:uncharacterized membrane protein YgdD (TMEM256/DUF423 family)